MTSITIDGTDYELERLTDEAKAQLASLQFCDVELQRLQAETASIQTARMAYATALKSELDRLAVTDSIRSEVDHVASDKKKGLFGNLFSKG